MRCLLPCAEPAAVSLQGFMQVTRKQFKSFLIDSPFEWSPSSAYPPGQCPPCGMGAFHQQYCWTVSSLYQTVLHCIRRIVLTGFDSILLYRTSEPTVMYRKLTWLDALTMSSLNASAALGSTELVSAEPASAGRQTTHPRTMSCMVSEALHAVRTTGARSCAVPRFNLQLNLSWLTYPVPKQ